MLSLSLFDILDRDSRVNTPRILLRLQDKVSLEVHELVEPLVFLHLEDEHICRLLSGTELCA